MRKHYHSGSHSKIFRNAHKNIRRGKFPCILPEKVNVKLTVDNAENSERENQNPQDLKHDTQCGISVVRSFVIRSILKFFSALNEDEAPSENPSPKIPRNKKKYAADGSRKSY